MSVWVTEVLFDPRITNAIVMISALSVFTIGIFLNIAIIMYPQFADAQNRASTTIPCSDPDRPRSCSPPTADPGPDRELDEGENINLDGFRSTDKDGNIISYQWDDEHADINCLEAGHLNAYDQVKVKFLANQVTKDCSIYYELTVTDNDALTNTKGVLITVRDIPIPAQSENTAPIANAGDDKDVKSGQTFRLDGTKSRDPDCDQPGNPNCGKLSYKWTRIDDGGTLRGLAASSKAKPKFTAPSVDAATVLKFSLTVNDQVKDSLPSTVNIAIDPIIKSHDPTENSPPIADAGKDQESNINPGTEVFLDGTGSHDPDIGDKIASYRWSQTSGPSVTLLGMDTVTPKFVVTPSTYSSGYEFQLVVTDTKDLESEPSNVKVILNSGPRIGTGSGLNDIMTIDNLRKSLPLTPGEMLIPLVASGGLIGGIIALKLRRKTKSSKCVTVEVDVRGGLKE